jgi:hypothetical protein
MLPTSGFYTETSVLMLGSEKTATISTVCTGCADIRGPPLLHSTLMQPGERKNFILGLTGFF